MADAPIQNPLEFWNQLITNSMKMYSPPQSPIMTEGMAHFPSGSQPHPPDNWTELTKQLWENNPITKALPSVPYDSNEFMTTFQRIWQDAFANPARYWTNYSDFMQKYTQVMTNTALKFWGMAENVPPVAVPEAGDKRFISLDWQNNAAFDALKQVYLLTASTMLKNVADVQGLDKKQHNKMIFYMRQFIDAISPTNFAFTNPQVVHETIQTGGKNLTHGMENFMRDWQAGHMKMTDTEAFTPGKNVATTPGKVVYRNKLIELLQYTPSTDKVHEVPILFIPPWINKFYILDLQPNNSLIKYMVDKGFTVFVISWKNPDAKMEDVTFEDYMTLGPLTAFDVIKNITGAKKINPVGYCIGGTLLAMTVPYLKAKGDNTVESVTLFVSLQDFEEVGDTGVFIDEPQMQYVEGMMAQKGYLDSEAMASMFNMLRANDLIWSSYVNNYLLGKPAPAFDLLSWNADGTRMTRAAHTYYLRNTYLENNLVKPNCLNLKGVPIDLGKISQDIYAVGTQQDHIVPWKSAWRINRYAGGKVRFILGGSGHIAGVISPPDKGRGYWTNDRRVSSADEWFETATAHKGHWWGDWVEWLKPHAGELVDPPTVGNKKYPPIAPAPGTYVLEK
jgi:polyhydroxyalkanoate synthase subunit PhaC